MIKKYSKLFLIAIASFFISATSSHAIKMTYDDLEKELEAKNIQSEYIYIIGNYVFTGDYAEYDFPDIMLAARSIDLTGKEGKVKDTDAYNAMTIFYMTRNFNTSLLKYDKLVPEENIVGETELPETLDVSYIDYDKINGQSSLSVNVNASEQMVNDLKDFGYDIVLNNQENFTALPSTNDPKTITLNGKVYKIKDIPNWAEEKKTGYYVAFEVVIPEEFKDQAKWWLSEDDKKTHDGKNYVVRAISKEADTKTFDVYVDFDGDGDVYEPAHYVFDYSNIDFAGEVSSATLSNQTDDVTVLGVLASRLNINSKDFVTIDENNNITGNIHYNPDVTVDPAIDTKTDYYIPVIVTIDKAFAETATIVTKNNNKTKTAKFKEAADNDDNNIMAVLFTVSPEDQDKTFTITIDLDGEGTDYEPKDYVYNYSQANFLAKPTAQVSATGKTENKAKYDEIMKPFGFEGNQETLKFNVEEDTVNLTGQLVNNKYKFNGEEQPEVDGYYFQYVIEISGDAANSSITIPTGPGKTEKIPYAKYDFKDENGVSGIVVLHKLNPDSETKQFTVTVDYDGDEQADKTYKFDYSTLDLDKSSEVAVTVSADDVAEQDKTTFENYGFPQDAYDLTTVENNVVKGTLPYIENSKGFSGDEATGNFMIYTIKLKDVNTEGKAEVKLSCTTGSSCQDGWKIVKVTQDENLSIMHHVKQNEDGSIKDIVAYVDLDGFDNNPQEDVASVAVDDDPIYLPYEVRLTFDKDIVVQKKSDVKVTNVTNDSNPGLKNWMANNAGIPEFSFDNYEVSQTGNTVKVTGDAQAQKNNSGNLEWYVAYKLVFDKKYDDVEITKANGQVLKQSNTSAWDGGTDGKEMTFVTKIESAADLTTTLKIDLDGQEKNAYSQVEYKIDCSEVKLLSNGVQFLKLDESKKSGFENWMKKKNFESFKLDDFTVEQDGTNVTISGTVNKNTTTTKSEDQYWIAYLLKLDKEYQNIEITKPNGNVENYANGSWDGNGHTEMTMTTNVTDLFNNKQPFEFTVDYDGSAGTLYKAVKYIVDWNGVTKAE